MTKNAVEHTETPVHCFRGNGYCLDCGLVQSHHLHNDALPTLGHSLYTLRIPGLPDMGPWRLQDAQVAQESAVALGITDSEIVYAGDTAE